MWTCNASNAECHVYSYKDGLLSAVAHDLQLRVTDWDLQADPDQKTLTARFNASSLEVVGAMQDGRLSEVSKGDKETIRGNIINDVLHAKKFADIRFQATKVGGDDPRYTVHGDLTLHGTTRPIQFVVSATADAYTAEVILNQPDYGIKPYSAMLGTLKIKPSVRIVIRIPKSIATG